MLLQGAMRGSQAPKRWGLAEAWHGASPEASRALRANAALAYLVYDASQARPQWLERGKRRGQSHGYMATAIPGNLMYPGCKLGSRRARTG